MTAPPKEIAYIGKSISYSSSLHLLPPLQPDTIKPSRGESAVGRIKSNIVTGEEQRCAFPSPHAESHRPTAASRALRRSSNTAGPRSVLKRHAALRNHGWSSTYIGGVSYRSEVASTSPNCIASKRDRGTPHGHITGGECRWGGGG